MCINSRISKVPPKLNLEQSVILQKKCLKFSNLIQSTYFSNAIKEVIVIIHDILMAIRQALPFHLIHLNVASQFTVIHPKIPAYCGASAWCFVACLLVTNSLWVCKRSMCICMLLIQNERQNMAGVFQLIKYNW